MTLIAHVSDLHLDGRKNETGATLAEQEELLMWIGEGARKRGASHILVGGDIYNTASTPEERNVACHVFEEWAINGPNVVICSGNHDRKGEMKIFNRLAGFVRSFERPDSIVVDDLLIHILPWPSKAMMVAQSNMTDRTEIDATALNAMRAMFLGFKERSNETDLPTVLLSHTEVGSAISDSGQPLAGKCDIELGEDDLLSSGADFVGLGHIHLRQILGGGWIAFSGSPRPTRWGEPGAKGYCLIDVNKGEKPEIEFVEAPNRAMVTIPAEFVDGKMVYEMSGIRIPEGADVRIQYTTDESSQHQSAEEVASFRDSILSDGARAVKVDPKVIPTTRIRSEAIMKAKTTEDRVRAWWDELGTIPEREKQIIEKLHQLEVETING